MLSISNYLAPQPFSTPIQPMTGPADPLLTPVATWGPGADTLSPSLGRFYRIHSAFQATVGRAPTNSELSALDTQLGPMPSEADLQAAVAAYAQPVLDPVAVRTLTKQVMTPYFEAIAQALAADPVIQSLCYTPWLTPEGKLQLVEQAKAIVSSVYQLNPLPTRLLDEAWEGGGYDFDTRSFSVTRQLLATATPGDLLYLVTHELTHAFQDQLIETPYPLNGPLGQLVAIWRTNQPHQGYIAYDAMLGNFETYANQPLEFAAFLGGNVVEHAVTGANSRTWGTPLEAPEMITAIA